MEALSSILLAGRCVFLFVGALHQTTISTAVNFTLAKGSQENASFKDSNKFIDPRRKLICLAAAALLKKSKEERSKLGKEPWEHKNMQKHPKMCGKQQASK